jgi:GT2 family glycosyltransferase
VAGFKDPRTVLVWPFWKRVLDGLSEFRAVPVVLVRSPHEVAMSLFTRSRGELSYPHCLDTAASHYRALQHVVAELPAEVPRITFGGPDYVGQVRRAAEACGLPWSEAAFAAAYDPLCYHQRPAVIRHEAEELFATLDGLPARPVEAPDNLERLWRDASAREALLSDRLAAARAEHGATRADLDRTRGELASTRSELETSTGNLAATRADLAATRADLAAARTEIATTRADLAAARGEIATARAQAARDRESLKAARVELEAARGQIAILNGALSLRLARALGGPFVRMAPRIRPPRPSDNRRPPIAPARGQVAELWFQVNHVWRTRGFRALVRETWRYLREGPKAPPMAVDRDGQTAPEAEENSYLQWVERNEPNAAQLARQRQHRFPRQPLISILVPVYRPPLPFLQAMLESVLAQTYSHWELCLADGNSRNPEVRRLLEELAAREARLRVRFLEENRGIAGNSAAALALAGGDYVALLDHDDMVAPFALFEVVRALNAHPEADFLYSDEDQLHNGQRCNPHFKPDWSPDTLESHNYICHLLVLRRDLLESAGGFRDGFEGSQDYDLVLRASERAKQIVHIPKVLYHWRIHPQSFSNAQTRSRALEAGRRAIESHLERVGARATVTLGPVDGTYQVVRALPRQPLVSILIPSHDQHQLLSRCLDSVARSTYRSYEVVLVENNSTEPETFAYYERLAERPEVRLLTWERPFNYAAVNNWGASQARGEVLLLLNNDTEVRNADWLERMLEHALRPEVGAVGAKLFYPDGSLQHGGVILGIGGVAGHAHKTWTGDAAGYFHRLAIAQNLSAVTAACLMLRREVFEEVGGLDERYILAFNDVDICVRIRQKGYRIVWTPFAELTHHETKTRGPEDTPEKQARFACEVHTFQETWRDLLRTGDPFYSPNLTLLHEDFSLRPEVVSTAEVGEDGRQEAFKKTPGAKPTSKRKL